MRKSTLVVLISSAVLLTDFYLFQTNIFAFWWHLRHGFHSEASGIRFTIPLFYMEDEPSRPNQFSVSAFASPIHKRWSFITVDLPSGLPKKALRPLPAEYAERLGYGVPTRRTAQFGNRIGDCFEYTQQQLVLRGYRVRTEQQPVWITCQFGSDIGATFDGSRNAVHEFYKFMETAQEVKD